MMNGKKLTRREPQMKLYNIPLLNLCVCYIAEFSPPEKVLATKYYKIFFIRLDFHIFSHGF